MSLLVFDGVCKRYWRGSRQVMALEGVSFELFDGELLAVLGGARSGKTSLLSLAAGIKRPDGGTVRVFGRDLGRLDRDDRAKMLRCDIGCVWPPERPPSGRVGVDHVALPLLSSACSRREAKARATQALCRVGAGHCAAAPLVELSRSELVRVSIAQAIVRKPRLLLADEPTGTLDLIERRAILAILRSVVQDDGAAVLMSTGDASGAVGSNRVLSLSDGRLLPPDSVESAIVVPLDRRARERRDGA